MLEKKGRIIVPIIAVAVSVMLFSLTSCTEPAVATEEPAAVTEEEKEPIKIGLVTWSEGTTLTAGRAYTRAFKSGIRYINDQGGILGGRMVEGVIAPQGMTSETAKSAALQLVMKEGVTVLIGPHWAGAAPAGLEVAQKYNLPFLLLQGGTWLYEQKDNAVACFAGNAFGRANAQTKWAEKQGYKKVLILACDIPYNKDVVNTAKENWSSPDSPELIDVIWYDWGKMDLRGEVTKAVGLMPDLIWCEEWSDTSATFILKQLSELEYKGDVVFTPEITKDTIGSLPKEVTEGAYVFKEWAPDPTVPENKEFTDLMVAEWGEPPDYNEEVIWSETVFILMAMDKAGTVADGSEEARNKIAEAMHSLEWIGPYGTPVKLSEGGLTMWDKLAMAKIKDGVFVLDQYLEMSPSEWLPWLE